MPEQQSSYWEKRIANNTWQSYNDIEARNRELLKQYQQAADDITSNLYKLSEKISGGEELTRTEMYRNNRLKSLQKRYTVILKDLATTTDSTMTAAMVKAMKENYTNVIDNVGKGFTIPPTGTFETLVKEPWRGSNFSKRLWKDTGVLNTELKNIMVTGLAQGKTVTQMAIQLNNAMNKGFNNAHRLVRTESMHYLNQSSLQAYKDANLKKVQFWAAEDERTCETCGAEHGTEYEINKAPILPLHPLCRCTFIPVIEDEIKVTKPGKSSIIKDKVNVDSLKGQLPDDFINDVKDIMEKAPDICKRVWNKYQNKIKINGYESSRAYYSPGGNYIEFNIHRDRNNRGGNMTTIFHEIGHLFDTNAGSDLYGTGGFSMLKTSKFYDNGALDVSLKKEVNDLVKERWVKLKEKDKTTSKYWAYNEIESEIIQLSDPAVSDISDIFEGVTKAKIKGGWGHGKSYWKDHNPSSEAFAEMYSATVNNPDSLEQIKKYFPKSYDLFIKMLEEIAKP